MPVVKTRAIERRPGGAANVALNLAALGAKVSLERRTSLGLLSEDLCPRTGERWGNFPQAYSMVGIIKGAMRLSRSWKQAF